MRVFDDVPRSSDSQHRVHSGLECSIRGEEVNQATFQAIGWFIGSAVLYVLASALAVLVKRKSNDMAKINLATDFALCFAFVLFWLGWGFLSVALFGGSK